MTKKRTIGVGVITLNEERNIKKCLSSVAFADEVVVIDSCSTDKTVDIALEMGANVSVNPWPGYALQKQKTLDTLGTDYKLILDADEFLTEKAQSEIKNLMLKEDLLEGYYLPRYLIFMGRTHYHGKGIDKQLRLIKAGCGKFDDRNIHEKIILKGDAGDLEHGALHSSSEGIRERLLKMRRDISMEMINDNNQSIRFRDFTLVPFVYFCAYFFKRRAYLDGLPGLVILFLATLQLVLLKWALLKRRIIR